MIATAAQAQDAAGETGGIEEIAVTAQKRAESAQDTPIAISAYSGEALSKMGVKNVADLAQNTPSLYSAPYPSSSNTITLYMRGLGVNDPMQITKDGSVGVYLDGFYMARPQTSTVDLADIERVEILRGPQGTLYGRNTTGGAVNVISRKPTGELNLRQNFSVGSRGRLRSLTKLDLPALGNLSVKGTFLYSNRNGWVKNIGNGPNSNDYNGEEQLGGRLAVRWQPSDALTVDYAFDRAHSSSTPIYYVNQAWNGIPLGPNGEVYTGDPFETYRPVNLPKSKTDTTGHSLTMEFEAADNLTIRSLTGYRKLKFFGYQDYAESLFIFFDNTDRMHSKAFSQELQFVGSLGDSLKYVGGLYYFDEKADHFQNVHFNTTLVGKDRFVESRSKSYAAYAQATFTPPILDDRLDLTVGARYTKDKRRATRDATYFDLTSPPGFVLVTDAGTSNSRKFERFNPSFTLNLRPTDDITTCAKVVTGYRAGGANESSLNFASTFAPEKVTSYEVGLKSDWLDRRVRFNAAGFIMDYKDLQLDTTPVAGDPSITDTVNAGQAKIKGIELDLTVQPFPDLTLTASYAYLDTKISKIFVEAGDLFNTVAGLTPGTDISNRYTLPFAPKHAVSLAADWTMLKTGSGELALHADYQWKDSAFLTGGAGPATPGSNLYVLPSRGIANARLTYSSELDGHKVSVSVWGRNVTDKKYVAHLFALGSVVSGYTNTLTAYAEPASYGVDLSMDF